MPCMVMTINLLAFIVDPSLKPLLLPRGACAAFLNALTRPDQIMSAQRLYGLDKSSTQFPEQLDELLRDKEWVEQLKLLPGGELVKLAGHLNDILDGIDHTSSSFRKCLILLQKICGLQMDLPSTYEVSGELSFYTTQAIAYGGFCDVYRGSLAGVDVCIKRLRISTTGDQAKVKQALCKEAVVWKHLDHPNIVPFKGVTFEPLQLVSEWMFGGELREYIMNNDRADLISLLIGVAKGLGYLHSCNVIHGDLKGANIVVGANGNARIVDFGLATVARDTNSLVSDADAQGITARYTAPEILRNVGRPSKESDVFSFGMVIIEVFTGNVPFRHSIAAAAIASIITGERPMRPTHSSFTDFLWILTQQCWKEKPQERPEMEQIIKQLSAPLFNHTTNTSIIDNRGSADQVPQMTLPQLIEPTRSHDPTGSLSTSASYAAKIHDLILLSPSSPTPQPPANLFGRDVILEVLLGLAERFVSITLFGAGGIGKTAIALTLLHDVRIAEIFGKHRHFMRCDDLESSLDGFLGRLSVTIGAHNLDMAQIQSHFSLSPPCILVFDGVESILDPLASGAAEIATAIEELGRHQNICLLATSRMDPKFPDFHRIEVPTLSVDGARKTFHSCCRLERSVAVDKLLAELDFHPLSIDLLASAVHKNGWEEPMLLEAWNYSKTDTLKASGRQCLEDNIESIFSTPTIRQLGETALETLKALADYPDGVKESKIESMFTEIAGVGDAANELCKFFLVYRQDGFIKMLSPFRFYFLESGQTLVTHPGSTASHRSAAEDNQCIRHITANSGPPVDTNIEPPRDERPGFTGRGSGEVVNPAPASELPRNTRARLEGRPGTPPGAKLIDRIRSANRKLQVIFRFSGGSTHPNRAQDEPANVQPAPTQQTPHQEASPYQT